MSSLLIFHLYSSQLLKVSTAQSFSSHRTSSQLILALLPVTKLLLPVRKSLHTKINAQRSFYAQKLETRIHLRIKPLHKESTCTCEAFTHRSFYTEKYLHTAFFLHTASWYTQKPCTPRTFLHTGNSYTEKLLHREASRRSKLLHRHSFKDR